MMQVLGLHLNQLIVIRLTTQPFDDKTIVPHHTWTIGHKTSLIFQIW